MVPTRVDTVIAMSRAAVPSTAGEGNITGVDALRSADEVRAGDHEEREPVSDGEVHLRCSALQAART